MTFKHQFPKWFSPDIISDIRLKNTLKHRLRVSFSQHLWDQFQFFTLSLKRRIKKASTLYHTRIEDQFHTNPK